MMIFCLYGSEDALDEELDQCLKQHDLHVYVPSSSEGIKLTNYNEEEKGNFLKQNRDAQNNEMKKKQKEEEIVMKGIQKMQIGKNEDEINRILRGQKKYDQQK